MTDRARELLARAGLVVAQYRWHHPEDQWLHKLSRIINEYLEDKEKASRPSFIRLTEEEIKNCWGEPDRLNTQALINFARAIEDALEEKNR
jgi:hypothetical protein